MNKMKDADSEKNSEYKSKESFKFQKKYFSAILITSIKNYNLTNRFLEDSS